MVKNNIVGTTWDSQNCLCFVDKFTENLEQIFSSLKKEIVVSEVQPKLFLNRCSLINEYKYIEALFVPEGVEEILYLIYDESYIKNLYISSTVKDIKIWTKKVFIKKGKACKFMFLKRIPIL